MSLVKSRVSGKPIPSFAFHAQKGGCVVGPTVVWSEGEDGEDIVRFEVSTPVIDRIGDRFHTPAFEYFQVLRKLELDEILRIANWLAHGVAVDKRGVPSLALKGWEWKPAGFKDLDVDCLTRGGKVLAIVTKWGPPCVDVEMFKCHLFREAIDINHASIGGQGRVERVARGVDFDPRDESVSLGFWGTKEEAMDCALARFGDGLPGLWKEGL